MLRLREVSKLREGSSCYETPLTHHFCKKLCILCWTIFVSLTDTPSLSVDRQFIQGIKGQEIRLSCTNHESGKMEWCRLGGNCVSSSSGSIDGVAVNITSNFTVTMSGLRTESSGWYWCDNGHLQMPVHLNVTDATTIAPPSEYNSFCWVYNYLIMI